MALLEQLFTASVTVNVYTPAVLTVFVGVVDPDGNQL